MVRADQPADRRSRCCITRRCVESACRQEEASDGAANAQSEIRAWMAKIDSYRMKVSPFGRLPLAACLGLVGCDFFSFRYKVIKAS